MPLGSVPAARSVARRLRAVSEIQVRTVWPMVCCRCMAIVTEKPTVEGLGPAVHALRDWQREGAPTQLHAGDLGWFWRFGADKTAEAVRTWSRDGQLLAVGLLDGPDLLRVAIDPGAQQDRELAARIAEDVSAPDRGVLPAGRVNVEAPAGATVHEVLAEAGWLDDEPWTPLRRDLSEPVEDPGVHIEVVRSERAAHLRTAVQRGAFEGSTFTDERWHDMASGLPYADARCVLALDAAGSAVAAVTVWSAGPGKPGVLEPVGVHRDHRGHGYGRAITLAAAGALRELGASSAVVCTPSSNVAAVATYRAGGFEPLPEIRDKYRPA